MLRFHLSYDQMVEYFHTFTLTDREIERSDSPITEYETVMPDCIDSLSKLLKKSGYRIGFQDSDDLFVNFDFYGQWLIHTELTYNDRRPEIEKAIHKACYELRPGIGVILDVKYPETRTNERSIITRHCLCYAISESATS